ncbi:hypothetical protein TSAR_016521 [Trichomalopsis sarcophagae]|uniref:Uncharacterized protein n=1 Tax=Trichomalopsis sarcophagae TaxID=543379 RepID=A0A232EZ83_9HYME|nr:hypothetical protein TSAR_016521 [Trichomalopsis sarcophagae]
MARAYTPWNRSYILIHSRMLTTFPHAQPHPCLLSCIPVRSCQRVRKWYFANANACSKSNFAHDNRKIYF